MTAWIVTSLILLSAGTAHADASAERGKAVFAAQCSRCHGPEGKGDGMDAKHLTVVPRDLTSGKFKFKSTVWGTPPSDEDIINGILGHGLAGSGMPSFATLKTETRADIVAYIKTISPAFKGGQAPQPVPRPANEHAKPDLSKGKEAYTKLQCASCHGPAGHANGTSAFTLVDAWNRPIRPANLTQGWTYRAGSKPSDIYNRIVAGIEGAPMPSYEGAASHEEMWMLANYVASLQLQPNWSYDVTGTKVTSALPTSGADALWDKAPRTDVNMQDYVYADGHRQHLTVNAISVQALYNDNAVALRIRWEDPQMDEKSPTDALLIAFKPADYAGDTRGNLHNLYEPNDPSLDLTYWQASNPNSAGWKEANLASIKSWSADKDLASNAVYNDGQWTVVVTRPFDTNSTEKWTLNSAHPIAFAAWDGRNNETGIRRSSSEWIQLHLGGDAAHGE
jgi:DMSO reductase family type II enzyme heme b subunit